MSSRAMIGEHQLQPSRASLKIQQDRERKDLFKIQQDRDDDDDGDAARREVVSR